VGRLRQRTEDGRPRGELSNGVSSLSLKPCSKAIKPQEDLAALESMDGTAMEPFVVSAEVDASPQSMLPPPNAPAQASGTTTMASN
jgi:hypothetical protein